MYDGWKIFVISLVVALIVSTGVCIAFYFLFVPYWEGRSALVDVPKVTDFTLENARLVLSSRNLLATHEEVEDPSVPKGQVIFQSPPAGYRIKKGGIVKLKVSSGTPSVEVPRLAGVSMEEAIRLLNVKGLRPGKTTEEYSVSIPPNHVISINPPSGTLIERGSAIDLIVSIGSEKVKVPRLYGKTLTSAQSILAARSLKLGNVNWTTSEEHPFDIVISQSPRSGSTVPKGSTINVTINREAY